MSKVIMTVRQITDLGLWDKVLEYKGWDPYILNEGLISNDDEVAFDSEFKKEDVVTVDDLKGKFREELEIILQSFESDLSSSGVSKVSDYIRNEIFYMCGMDEEYYEEAFDELRDGLTGIVK